MKNTIKNTNKNTTNNGGCVRAVHDHRRHARGVNDPTSIPRRGSGRDETRTGGEDDRNRNDATVRGTSNARQLETRKCAREEQKKRRRDFGGFQKHKRAAKRDRRRHRGAHWNGAHETHRTRDAFRRREHGDAEGEALEPREKEEERKKKKKKKKKTYPNRTNVVEN